MDWQEVAGNWVTGPRNPIGIIHFLGGAFVAAAPHVTYRWWLESLANQGYLVIATSFLNTLDHQAIAQTTLASFTETLEELYRRSRLKKRYLPIYGIGHSMGCKLHLLIGAMAGVERAGNVLVSFNNFSTNKAIPFMEQLNQINSSWNNLSSAIEFTPTPEETKQIISQNYQVRRNLLVKFRSDDIDQTRELSSILINKFPAMVTVKILPGSHITPTAQDFAWQTGKEFSPVDAIAHWVKQEVLLKDIKQLQQEVVKWLQPRFP